MSLLRAILFPFYAGVPSSGSFYQNDGRISGYVFAVAFISFSCCAAFVSSYRDKTSNKYGYDMTVDGNIFLMILCTLAIVSCGIVIILHARKNSAAQPSMHTEDHSIWLKLKFLYFFGLGGVVNEVISYLYKRHCSNVENATSLGIRIIIVVLFVVQTIYIRIMFRYRLFNIKIVFYAMGVLLITNISVWTHYTVTGFNVTPNSIEANMTLCTSSSSIYQAFWKSRCILDPMILEYVLLASIFVYEMWPKRQAIFITTEQNIVDDNRMENNIKNTEIVVNGTMDDSERTPLIQTYSFRSRPLCCGSAVTILAFPIIILKILDINYGTYNVGLLVCFCFSHSLMIVLAIKCFHFLKYCRPTETYIPRSFSNSLLVLGMFGHVFFLTLSLFTNIFRNDGETLVVRTLGIYHEITQILSSFVHVVLILQMQYLNFYKLQEIPRCVKLDDVCLALGIIHLAYWIYNSFLSASYRWSDGYENQYFGVDTYDILFHVFFPFGIFFHFKCFVSFYNIFKGIRYEFE